jgi:hypothetical protein
VVRGYPQATSEEKHLETGIARVAADQIATARIVPDQKIGNA